MFSWHKKMQRDKWLLLAALWVLLDQWTKYLSITYLSINVAKPIFPGFDLVLRYNQGAAFNLLSDASGWQRWFFIVLAVLISVIVIYWIGCLSIKEKREAWGLSLILGGAIGNLIDRVIHGKVVDFILIYYQDWEWPAFNIADSVICIGVVLLIPKILK